MTTYRRKAEPVEAWQIANRNPPPWVAQQMMRGQITEAHGSRGSDWWPQGLLVKAAGKEAVPLKLLDWIVRDRDGCLQALTKDEFDARYEAVADDPPAPVA